MYDQRLMGAVNRPSWPGVTHRMDGKTTHRNLLAWQEAMTLVEVVYRDTARFPHEEMFGLKSQIRPAAVSVPSNIAEGSARGTPGELVQFLGFACGSLAELETQLQLAVRLGYMKTDAASIEHSARVGMLVRTLRKSRRAALSIMRDD
jgi:four helix bundle protein